MLGAGMSHVLLESRRDNFQSFLTKFLGMILMRDRLSFSEYSESFPFPFSSDGKRDDYQKRHGNRCSLSVGSKVKTPGRAMPSS